MIYKGYVGSFSKKYSGVPNKRTGPNKRTWLQSMKYHFLLGMYFDREGKIPWKHRTSRYGISVSTILGGGS